MTDATQFLGTVSPIAGDLLTTPSELSVMEGIDGELPAQETTLQTIVANQGKPVAALATTVAASNLIFKAAPGSLLSLNAVVGATAGYIMLFNATTAPADGTVTPAWCYPVPANGALNMAWLNALLFSVGIVAVFSSTGPFTKTASATAFLSGQVQ